MSERAQRGWMAFAVILPLFTVALTGLARNRTDFARVWPIWRPMLLDLTLVVAGAVLLAGVVAGVMAWRKGAHA